MTITATTVAKRLHSQLPPSTLWTYEGQFPGPTIEVAAGQRLRVAWTNAIEGTMPFVGVAGPLADAPTSRPGRELHKPGYRLIEGIDQLPGWTVTHLHGARTNAGNDGWAHNAVLRDGVQLVEYPNTQEPTTLWYHDHAMAMTRLTVFAGLAGLYIVRPTSPSNEEPPVPLVLCDRNFDLDDHGAPTGELLFKVAETPTGALVAFSGPFNLVNGALWPYLDVAATAVGFRLLNASTGRIYRLQLLDETNTDHTDAVEVVGTDGGTLPRPVAVPPGGLSIAPAERFELLIDFTRFAGQRLRLVNTDAQGADPDVLQFRIATAVAHAAPPAPNRTPPTPTLRAPAAAAATTQSITSSSDTGDPDQQVWVALLLNQAGHPEMWDLEPIDTDPGGPGIVQITDPATDPPTLRTFRRVGRSFDDTVGVFLAHGTWVQWNFVHLGDGGPTHPMHIHLTEFHTLFRRTFTTTFDPTSERTTSPLANYTPSPLLAYEHGWKDTIQVHPGEWAAIRGYFGGGTGAYMYHCHILDHEDEGMMRPFIVQPAELEPMPMFKPDHPFHTIASPR